MLRYHGTVYAVSGNKYPAGQPTAYGQTIRKTVEANIHMLADRMMTLAGDPRMMTVTLDTKITDDAATRRNREALLAETAES